jgi:hypothetical protein
MWLKQKMRYIELHLIMCEGLKHGIRCGILWSTVRQHAWKSVDRIWRMTYCVLEQCMEGKEEMEQIPT